MNVSVLTPYLLRTFLTDPPPAQALLLTDNLLRDKIEKLLTDDKYTQKLKLVVEEIDEEKLREAEKRRRERDYVVPNLVQKPVGKGKSKSK